MPIRSPFPGFQETMRKQNAAYALVTGACSGIGLALAEGLAARGHNLLLVSNREAPLAETRKELVDRFGIEVITLVLDLAIPSAASALFGEVNARRLAVEILVNNAGVFFFGEVADAAPEHAERLLTLHVITPSLLSTYFGKQMRSRRSGRILFVSSISAFGDFPGIAYYGSSKKYLRGFAASLRSELSAYGITVTCLLPGATATALYDRSRIPVDLAQRIGVMAQPHTVAQQGLAALFSGQAECVPGLTNRVLSQIAAHTPQSFIDLLRRHAPWLPKP